MQFFKRGNILLAMDFFKPFCFFLARYVIEPLDSIFLERTFLILNAPLWVPESGANVWYTKKVTSFVWGT